MFAVSEAQTSDAGNMQLPLKYSMFENVGGQKSTSTSQKPLPK